VPEWHSSSRRGRQLETSRAQRVRSSVSVHSLLRGRTLINIKDIR